MAKILATKFGFVPDWSIETDKYFLYPVTYNHSVKILYFHLRPHRKLKNRNCLKTYRLLHMKMLYKLNHVIVITISAQGNLRRAPTPLSSENYDLNISYNRCRPQNYIYPISEV